MIEDQDKYFGVYIAFFLVLYDLMYCNSYYRSICWYRSEFNKKHLKDSYKPFFFLIPRFIIMASNDYWDIGIDISLIILCLNLINSICDY